MLALSLHSSSSNQLGNYEATIIFILMIVLTAQPCGMSWEGNFFRLEGRKLILNCAQNQKFELGAILCCLPLASLSLASLPFWKITDRSCNRTRNYVPSSRYHPVPPHIATTLERLERRFDGSEWVSEWVEGAWIMKWESLKELLIGLMTNYVRNALISPSVGGQIHHTNYYKISKSRNEVGCGVACRPPSLSACMSLRFRYVFRFSTSIKDNACRKERGICTCAAAKTCQCKRLAPILSP